MNKKNIIAGILGIIFIALIVLIKTNVINKFDTFIYKLLTFRMNDIFTSTYKVFTFLGSTVFIVSLVIFFFILFIILKKKNISFIIASCLIISTIVNNVIKIIIRRERPTVLRLVTEKSFSFPSGHTMAAVSMYGILIYIILKSNIDKRIKTILSVILALLPIFIAVSRIYLGAHFASDVIGGVTTSTILLLIETNIIDKKKWL